MRSLVQRSVLALAAVLGLLGTQPATANAQKALVYCPVAIDATGCTAIVNALTGPAYPLGVDRGYDGTGGTVDLETVDLFTYSVFVVPSLADDATSQPYAKLRDPEVVEHLKAALIGRIAMWSGSPDQGATNRAMKDALIQNLAGWASGAFGVAKGPGLVALLDASSSTATRYDWVRAITPLPVTADANLLIYSNVRALDPLATQILTSGAGPIVYDNMATFGFQVPNGAPGVSLDAVGQTGTTQGGQVVLVTMEAGNSSGALVRTDRDDYPPGETVTITGSGWLPGETVKLSLHMDPLRDTDTELTATADGNGNFTNTDFAPAEYDLHVRFVLTAIGQTSGRRAQTTFTDGRTITSVTLNGGSSVSVTGGATISVQVNVTTDNGGGNQNWRSTSWRIATTPPGAVTCQNTVNHDGSGSYSETFNITAPTGAGTYNAYFIAYSDDACANQASATLVLVNAVTVTPPNAAPSFTKGADQTVNEDAGAQTVSPWATAISAGPGEGTQTVDFIVTNDNNALFSVQPAVSPSGTLTYTPAANANGSATVTVRIHDNGGTANGGVDTSAPQTFTITVNAVNDPPSFAKGPDQTVLEDAGAQTVSPWATAISAGPADENAQTVNFTVTNDNNALFSVQPAVSATGTLTYTAAANASGSATVTVKLHDDGGGSDTSADQTFTITITPINDAPSFTKGADQTVNEDAGAQTVAGWASAISAGPDETQTLTFQVSSNNATLFSAGPSISPTGTLTYTTAPDANGSATITVVLKDDGGTANGGVDASPAQTFTITVGAVNDAPSFAKGGDQTVDEDALAQTVTNWATGISAGPADEETQAVDFVVTNDNNALFSVQPVVSANGTLTFAPAPNAFGSATVTVKSHDDGGTLNGGVDTSAPQTFTITVNPVNDAPSFTKGADQTVLEDSGPHTMSPWATAISAGPTNENAQTVSFEITANTNPGLFSSGPAVAADGSLSYTPAANANGSATITLRIHDNGGTANGGVDVSSTQSFVVNVTAVNDAPTFVKGADQTVLEDAGAQTVNGWATAMTAGPADESGQSLTFSTTNDNNGLFSVQPSIAADGTLTYTPVANAYGSAIVTVALKDNGGLANGGVDESSQTFSITVTPVNDAPSFAKGADQTVDEDVGSKTVSGWATAISAGPNEPSQTVDFVVSNDNNGLFSVQPSVAPNGTLTYTPAANAFGTATVTLHIHDNGGTDNGGVDASANQTFVITVNSVNDAPSFTRGADEAVLEDSGPHTINAWATSISAGPSNESGQAVDFLVTNDNNTLFTVQPAIAADGSLAYTAAPDAFGSAIVTVRIHDDGGTLNGGVDTSAPQTFTITVNPVNDAPSFTKGADQNVLEDGAPVSVPSWATSISKGPPNESSQSVTFEVSATNGALFTTPPAVSPTGTLTYTLAPNANGASTVTLRIKDDGGTVNGGVDTSPDQTFTITITAVNDAPSFTKGLDQSVLEDAAAVTAVSWATGISKGPPDESGQALDFIVTNDNNGLFTTQPAVDASGNLTYTVAPNAYGLATVTVKLHDNGGTANGGDDTSDDQTFTVTVTPVNDAPSFTKGLDQTVLEDAPAQSVAGWATAISPGPNEASQLVDFVVSNDNNTLFAVQPAVDAAGKLTYTLAANANGSATVTLHIHDNGGTANGGVDASASQSFTITVTPVNDAPTYDVTPPPASDEDAGLQTVNNVVTNKSAGPANESGQTLTLTVTNNNISLFTTQPAIDGSGTLTYTAAPNKNGSATVTVVLQDNGGTANGGVDATTKTFTITVNKENDVPVINTFTSSAVPNAVNTLVTATGTFTDVDLDDSPPDVVTANINWGDASSSAATITGTGITRTVNGSHTYTAAGVYTVTLTVTDAALSSDVEIYQYVVVYDPNGGFVTGGGWINSPAGAYVAAPSLAGKATFGFVSKYKKGQSTPDGSTEFQFHAAGMNFKSIVYEWLVVAGAKAQFKGTGTINGSGNYGFLLTAIDGQINGGGGSDKFRIKIWDINNDGAIVYDNNITASDTADPTTLLGGGSINIQAK